MDVNRVFAGIKNFLPIFDSRLTEVNFHYMGGEPLLAWEEILALNELGRRFLEERGISFVWSLTSNLIALDEEKTERMIREKAGIHCSIDGPAHIHNKNRPYRKAKKPSFDDVVKNIPLALQITPHDTARVTVCPEDAKNLLEITETILELGFQTVGLFPAYNMDWGSKDVDDWAKGISDSFSFVYGEKEGKHISTVVKPRRKCNKEVDCFYYCGAGKGLWAFNIDGELYFCHHLTNDPFLAIIDAPNSSTDQIRIAIENSSLPAKPNLPSFCLDCSAKEFCNGGCWSDNFLTSGNPSIPRETECVLRRATVDALDNRLYIDPVPNKDRQLKMLSIRSGASGLFVDRACPKCYECEKCYNCEDCEHYCQARCEQACQNCEGACMSHCEKNCQSCQREDCSCEKCEHCTNRVACDNSQWD